MTERSPEQKEASRYLSALGRAVAGIPVSDWRKMPIEERRKYVAVARRVVNVQKKWASRGEAE